MIEQAEVIVLHGAQLLKGHLVQLLIRIPVQGVKDLKLVDIPRHSHTHSKWIHVLKPQISRLGLIETIAELTINAPIVSLTALGLKITGSPDDLGFDL